MIKIGDHHISTIVLSSALGHSGRGLRPYLISSLNYRRLVAVAKEKGVTIISKSSTLFERQGNHRWWWPWGCVRRLPNQGLVNAFGLTNKGVTVHAREILRSIERGFQVIPSFFPEFDRGRCKAANGLLVALDILRQTLGEHFWAIELDFSCINSGEPLEKSTEGAMYCIEKAKKHHPDIAIIGKVSIVQPLSLSKDLERAGVDVIHGVNSLPWKLVFPEKTSPLIHFGGGGVSGEPAFRMALEHNIQIRQTVRLPMIMGGGVSRISDAEHYFTGANADAVSIATLAARNPRETIRIIKHSQ